MLRRAGPPGLAVLVLLLACCSGARAQALPPGAERRIEDQLRKLEVKPLPAPPVWYTGEEPLFRFVQISDFHLTKRRESLLKDAMAFINETVKPAFTAVTGDNAGRSDVASQRRLEDLLGAGLDDPWYIIRGDNWARNFSKVFGSTRYAFECGGIRFVFAGLDRDEEGKGVGVFAKDTWAWLERELAPKRPLSVILFLHENVQPPVFVDATKLDNLLEASPAAAASFTGHLHLDLEFQTGRVKHILAPGFGPHRFHGFKVCEVFENHVAVRTVERHGGRYGYVPKYQKVDLPHPARAPAAVGVEAYRALPARETDFDFSMRDHLSELLLQITLFARRIGRLEQFREALRGREDADEEENEEEEF